MDDILKRLEKLENITSFEYFTGIGFDSHKFDPSKMGIVLGGVNIPYEKGFYAHSDGDVFFHAVIDSLLGASAMGDIGTLFPDTDPDYKGISSAFLLEDVDPRRHGKGLSFFLFIFSGHALHHRQKLHPVGPFPQKTVYLLRAVPICSAFSFPA